MSGSVRWNRGWMSGSMGWSPGLMRWRSSLVSSTNARPRTYGTAAASRRCMAHLEGLLEGLREAISVRSAARSLSEY